MSARSPLSRASIFHTYPLSQPCPYLLFLAAPPTGFFADVYIIAGHKKAVVLYCLHYLQAARNYFNNGKKRGKFINFLECYANVSECSGKIKEPHISQF